MEEALTLAESMDARGHGRGPRSRYRPERFEACAWASMAVALASLLAFALSGLQGRGDMAVTGWPLQWPGASALLVAAALAFAAPAFFRCEEPDA
jgi:hypothetical protein